MRYMVYGYKGDFHFHCYVRSPESSKKVSTIWVWMAFLKSILGTTYDVKCDLHREPHLRMNDIWYLINTSIPIISYISQKNGLHLNPETFKKKNANFNGTSPGIYWTISVPSWSFLEGRGKTKLFFKSVDECQGTACFQRCGYLLP